jgi:DNA recombination protein RmuC
MDDITKTTTETKTSINQHIETLLKTTADIGSKADNLANALKNNKKAQGNWGELQLKNLFESINMIEGADYKTQESIRDKKGNLFYLDFLLHLPGNKKLIVDAKVSMVNYASYIECEDDVAKEQFLKAYCNDIENHIKELGGKEYQNLFDAEESVGFVFMFLPLEGAYLDALRYDNSLLSVAHKNKVAIVTASSLMPILRMIEHLWNIENQNRYINDAVELVKNIYEKLQRFKVKLENIGKCLDEAKVSYEDGYKYLETGNANIFITAERIQDLITKGKIDGKYDLLKDAKNKGLQGVVTAKK